MTSPSFPSKRRIAIHALYTGVVTGVIFGGTWWLILFLTGGWPLFELVMATGSAFVVAAGMGLFFGIMVAVHVIIQTMIAIARLRKAADRKTEETKMTLEIKNLHVKLEDEDKQILKGVNLTVEAGKVHAIMGPNGSGKSTLSYVLSGRDGYEVTEGSATLGGEELLELDPEERAAMGVFLAFQYPVEIPGVGNMTFLRTAVNAQRKARGEEELSASEFLKVVREKAKTLKISPEMLKRPVNVGFSGGEKKRNEILQMAMLEPKMCILDETDSGLDVDAMKLVAEGVNALRSEGRGFLVITHYQRLLDHIKPDVVHIMANGRIVKTGGPELALEVENNGYADILAEVA